MPSLFLCTRTAWDFIFLTKKYRGEDLSWNCLQIEMKTESPMNCKHSCTTWSVSPLRCPPWQQVLAAAVFCHGHVLSMVSCAWVSHVQLNQWLHGQIRQDHIRLAGHIWAKDGLSIDLLMTCSRMSGWKREDILSLLSCWNLELRKFRDWAG